MTIRFIKSWNGYYEGQIVTSPNGGNTEAQLIALGYAVADLDGPDNGALPVMATTNPVTGRIRTSAGASAFFAQNPAVVAIRDAAKSEQAINAPDYAYRQPLLDGAALPLNGSVLYREIYTSGGKVWGVSLAGTTGATGPVVGSNPADVVSAGAGTAKFMYLCDKKTALSGDSDIPVVTFVRPNTLTSVSSYMVADYGSGGSFGNAQLYEFTGSLTPAFRAGAAMPGRYVNSGTWYGLTAGIDPSLLGYDQNYGRSVGFSTRSKRVFIGGPGGYSPQQYGVEVNGKPLYDLGVFNNPATLAGGNCGILLTFPTRELRTFWVQMPYDAEFQGVVVDAGEKISKPNISDVRITFEGDSLTENAANAGAFYRSGTWPEKVGRRLGIRSVWNASIGGTGFVSPGSSNVPLTHPRRMQVVIDSKPDLVVVGGAHNDGSFTSAARVAAFTLWYQTVRAALPGTVILFFGTTPLLGESSSTYIDSTDVDLKAVVDAAIAAGDALVGFIPTVDKTGARWVPDGTIGPNYSSNIGDGHPSQHGIDFLAEMYTSALCDYVTRVRRD